MFHNQYYSMCYQNQYQLLIDLVFDKFLFLNTKKKLIIAAIYYLLIVKTYLDCLELIHEYNQNFQ